MPENTTYECNDGGIYYYVAFSGWGESGTVVWFGGHPDGTFGNVLWGNQTGRGQMVEGFAGEWWDVPYGKTHSRGRISCKYSTVRPEKFSRTRATGGFGGSKWTPVEGRKPKRLPLPIPEDSIAGEGLTGVWRTNTDALYYIKQSDQTVLWFAAHPSGSAANVFKGTRQDNTIRGQWIDVPWGEARYYGDMVLETNDFENVLWKVSSSRGYGSSAWLRLR